MVELNSELVFSDNYTTGNPVIKKLQSNFYKNIHASILKRKNEISYVLELGAGEGYSTERLISYVGNDKIFMTSDLHFELVLRNSKKSLCANLLVFDINNPPLVYKKVDIVIALEVLEHIPNPDKSLEEISRLTKKYALISVPFEPWWRIGNILRGAYIKDFGNTPDHVNHWTARSLKIFLLKQFNNVEIKISFPWIIGICSH